MPRNSDDKGQLDEFRGLARDLEAEEDEAALEEKVRKVANTPSFPPRPATEL